ncbi:MAG: ATP-dependent DNA helicase RecQ [Myxococcota bacterium]
MTLQPLSGARRLDFSRAPGVHPTRSVIDHEDNLQQRFGLPSFRPWQREAIDEILDGCGRVLVVAPTGGGKSLTYQYPATVLQGTTVVVSPLIALMEDQVRALDERGIAATYLASTLPPEVRREREQRLERGHYRIVYVAPERLRNPYLRGLLERLAPPLVAIDEAHCISQWGHDFRPDYLRLGETLAALRPPRVLACTATATPRVREEIVARLGLPAGETRVYLRGFARPNLHFEVEELDGLSARTRVVKRRLSEVLQRPGAGRGSAIVYAGTRKNTEKLARAFASEGWRAEAYHAGLEASQREQVSTAFAEGALEVVVATNAFGMGIDRPDIRLVAHTQAPGSIEQYYQEVGRAGRDGAPAHGLLLSGSADFGFRRRLIESSVPEDSAPEERTAWVDRQWNLFIDLMRYVEAGSCRHDFILRYFGDEGETLGGCGHCDVCERLDGDVGPPAITEEDAITVRKALSGVARLRGRAGLTVLSQSLHGDDNQRTRQLRLTELSTHGLLSGHPLGWIQALLRRLMTADLVGVTASDYPVPFLTPRGRDTMKGTTAVRVMLPPAHVGRTSKGRGRKSAARRGRNEPPPLDDASAALFERLRETRREVAREKGVPAYVVCHDRTLIDMANRRPVDVVGLGDVHGMGPARIEAYGDRFLTVLREV